MWQTDPLLTKALVFLFIAIFMSSCTNRSEPASFAKAGSRSGATLAKGLQAHAWCLEPAGRKVAVFRKDGSLFVRTFEIESDRSVTEQSEYFWRADASGDSDALLVSDDDAHWNRYPIEITLLNTGETRVSINGESWISCR